MGMPLDPEYIPYSYKDPLGHRSLGFRGLGLNFYWDSVGSEP